MLDTIFMRILDMSKTASLVILVVILARLCLKRAPKVFSYALWAVVLFRLLCPVSFEAPLSLVPEMEPVSQGYTLEDTPISFAGAGQAAYHAVGDALNGGLGIQNIPTTELEADGSVHYVQAGWDEVWILFGKYLWLAGIGAMLLYSMLSYIKLRKKLKAVLHLRENIYIADDIPSPFVVGLFRPKIYLPGSLKAGEQGYIILHEQMHIRRLDPAVKMLAFLALSLHWFNPLVWLAFVLACKDMEMCCDEAVLRKLGTEVRANYAASLLSLATGRRIIAGTPLAFGEGNTGGRIRNLAKWKKPALWLVLAAVLLCGAVLLVCALDPQSGAQSNPFGQSYRVTALDYCGGMYSFVQTPENSPLYRVSPLGKLMQKAEGGEWEELGNLMETELTKENFDSCFYPPRSAGGDWEQGLSAPKLRRGNQRAWYLRVEEDPNNVFYYLLQQKDGSIYLSYGYHDPDGETDPHSDDSSIRWLFRLQPEASGAEAGAYVSWNCLYMNPFSSRMGGSDSGIRYLMGEDSFTLEYRNGSTQVLENISWNWQPFPWTDEEWEAMFWNGAGMFTELPVSKLYVTRLYQPLNDEYCLLQMNGQLWLAEIHENAEMGQYVWSIYSLVPESFMGTAQWEYAPWLSSQFPAFRFIFDMPYTEISAVCTESGLVAYDHYGKPHSTGVILHEGQDLYWSPLNEMDEIVSWAQIYFIARNGEEQVGEGSIYIQRDEQGIYTARLVAGGLNLQQNSEYPGGVLTRAEAEEKSSFGFSELAPGETAFAESGFTVAESGAELAYQMSYARSGLTVEIGLVDQDGNELTSEVVGGQGRGGFLDLPAGNYRVFVRNSSRNLDYADTTTESLNVSGAVVYDLN